MNYLRLQDDVVGVVVRHLHYFDNYERCSSMKTAAEANGAIEGGIERYRNDPIFRAKAESMTAVLMQIIRENVELYRTDRK